MISLLKHYFDARFFRIIGILSLLLFMCLDNFAQSQSIGHGVYTIFNDYARTHWKSADSVEQVIDHISSYPRRKRKDLKESIIYLQSKTGYIYYQDTINCYFDSEVCTFMLPQHAQPCELMADTSVDAYLKKIKVAPVCFDKDGHVVYSAQIFLANHVSKIQKEIRTLKSQRTAFDGTWIPIVIKKEDMSVQNYCTHEYLDSNIQTLVLRYINALWKIYPHVTEVRFGLHFPPPEI